MKSCLLPSLILGVQFLMGSAALGQELEIVRRVKCDSWTNLDGTLVEMREAESQQCVTPQLAGMRDRLFGLLFPTPSPVTSSTFDPEYKIPLERPKLVEFFSHYCIQENAGGGNYDMWDRPPPDINGSSPPCDRANMPRAHLRRTINLQDPKEPLISYPPTGMEIPSSRLDKRGREMLNALIALIRREDLDAQAKREEAAHMKYLDDLGVSKFMGKQAKDKIK